MICTEYVVRCLFCIVKYIYLLQSVLLNLSFEFVSNNKQLIDTLKQFKLKVSTVVNIIFDFNTLENS